MWNCLFYVFLFFGMAWTFADWVNIFILSWKAAQTILSVFDYRFIMPEAQLLLSLIQQFIAIQSFISKFDVLIRRAAVGNISHIIHSLLYCTSWHTSKNPITNLATLAIDIFSLWYPKFVKSSKDVKNACQKAWGREGGSCLGWGCYGRTLAQGGLRRGKLIKSLKRTNVLRRH